jgi:hypothetical protein
MKDLGTLKKYGKPLAERLLEMQHNVGPRSHVTTMKFNTASAAQSMVHSSSQGAYAIVPDDGKPIAFLSPSEENDEKFHVIHGPLDKVPPKVQAYLQRETLKDVYGLFRAINQTYGKQHWELHEITPDLERVENQEVSEPIVIPKAVPKEEPKAVPKEEPKAVPKEEPKASTRGTLTKRLTKYRKSRLPKVSDTSEVLGLIMTSTSLPAKFMYNSVTYELSLTRFGVDSHSGKFYPAPAKGDMIAGLVYRANMDDYSKATQELDDKTQAEQHPKAIEIHYEMREGSFSPVGVQLVV